MPRAKASQTAAKSRATVAKPAGLSKQPDTQSQITKTSTQPQKKRRISDFAFSDRDELANNSDRRESQHISRTRKEAGNEPVLDSSDVNEEQDSPPPVRRQKPISKIRPPDEKTKAKRVTEDTTTARSSGDKQNTGGNIVIPETQPEIAGSGGPIDSQPVRQAALQPRMSKSKPSSHAQVVDSPPRPSAASSSSGQYGIPSRDVENSLVYSKSEERAFVDLELYMRQEFLVGGFDRERTHPPIARAFPGLATSDPIYLRAEKKVVTAYRNWRFRALEKAQKWINKLISVDEDAAKIRKSTDFVAIRQQLNAIFQVEWVGEVFSFAAEGVDLEACSKRGSLFLRYAFMNVVIRARFYYFYNRFPDDDRFRRYDRDSQIAHFDALHKKDEFYGKLSVHDFPLRPKKKRRRNAAPHVAVDLNEHTEDQIGADFYLSPGATADYADELVDSENQIDDRDDDFEDSLDSDP